MGLNHIEVQILECIDTFEREIQFYAAHLDYIAVCITF